MRGAGQTDAVAPRLAQVPFDRFLIGEFGRIQPQLTLDIHPAVVALHQVVVLQQEQQILDVPGKQQVVVAQVEQRLAAGSANHAVPVGRPGAPGFRQVEELDPPILGGQFRGDLSYLRCRAVADDHHVDVADGLRERALRTEIGSVES